MGLFPFTESKWAFGDDSPKLLKEFGSRNERPGIALPSHHRGSIPNSVLHTCVSFPHTFIGTHHIFFYNIMFPESLYVNYNETNPWTKSIIVTTIPRISILSSYDSSIESSIPSETSRILQLPLTSSKALCVVQHTYVGGQAMPLYNIVGELFNMR
ncbi:hypothetical protein CDAR_462531 [Caerostris darwini]|uniref:Cytochrome c biogenesis B n=1 Tax=Caerostris darwini TaxID=1538125 RepID=A0AAV4WPN9_9ARAC|nr:hypothetical protein CDAR_462531 [Caerostris darwini]